MYFFLTQIRPVQQKCVGDQKKEGREEQVSLELILSSWEVRNTRNPN